jgi:hypothetical protein
MEAMNSATAEADFILQRFLASVPTLRSRIRRMVAFGPRVRGDEPPWSVGEMRMLRVIWPAPRRMPFGLKGYDLQ